MQSRQPSQHPPPFRPDQLPAESAPSGALPQRDFDGAAPDGLAVGATRTRQSGPVAPVAPAASAASAAPLAQMSEVPRPEHPRPDFQREGWLNLNGRWRFSFDPQNEGEQQRWYHVPHPVVAARFGESS